MRQPAPRLRVGEMPLGILTCGIEESHWRHIVQIELVLFRIWRMNSNTFFTYPSPQFEISKWNMVRTQRFRQMHGATTHFHQTLHKLRARWFNMCTSVLETSYSNTTAETSQMQPAVTCPLTDWSSLLAPASPLYPLKPSKLVAQADLLEPKHSHSHTRITATRIRKQKLHSHRATRRSMPGCCCSEAAALMYSRRELHSWTSSWSLRTSSGNDEFRDTAVKCSHIVRPSKRDTRLNYHITCHVADIGAYRERA